MFNISIQSVSPRSVSVCPGLQEWLAKFPQNRFCHRSKDHLWQATAPPADGELNCHVPRRLTDHRNAATATTDFILNGVRRIY
jgi:hypothetical protein